jgi:hypothetical protein
MTDTVISQIALVSVVNEAPPVAGGALINQIAVVTVGVEYTLPLHLHGWLIRSIQGFPYFIEG